MGNIVAGHELISRITKKPVFGMLSACLLQLKFGIVDVGRHWRKFFLWA